MQINSVANAFWRITVLCLCFIAPIYGADSALTIYNQNFAVIRETVPLDLKVGSNTVSFDGATAQMEPDSVILRDSTGARAVQILEQNYRNDPISQEWLLNLYEGKTIDFQVRNANGTMSTISGKIVRSGYTPGYQPQRNAPFVQPNGIAVGLGGAGQPVIEVGGKLQFSLPGQPIFPALADDTILKPALDWILIPLSQRGSTRN